MLIIMLNFLIAIISETYDQVVSQKGIYNYMLKAELNYKFYS